MGAHLNVKINCAGLKDAAVVAALKAEADAIAAQAVERERAILAVVEAKL